MERYRQLPSCITAIGCTGIHEGLRGSTVGPRTLSVGFFAALFPSHVGRGLDLFAIPYRNIACFVGLMPLVYWAL